MLSVGRRHLIRQTVHLTWASLKSRYRKTIAGFIWVLLNPLIMFGVQSLVFKRFLGLELPNYYVFLLSGLLPWIFMSQTIQMGTPTLVSNSGVLKAFQFHPAVLVASTALDNFVNFILALLIIAIPVLIGSDAPLVGLLLIPFCLIPFILGTFALTMLFALMNVFFRDTNFLLGFMFSILFFLTPVFYPVEYIPHQYQWMVDLNPLYQFLRPFRVALYDPQLTDFAQAWSVSMLWAVGLGLVSYLYWRKKRNGIYIHL